MSSSITSSHILSPGIDAPFHMVNSSSSLSSPLPSAVSSALLPPASATETCNVMKQSYSSSLSSPSEVVTGMSSLLNSKSLVQATEDEKLVVATLATLDSGSASTLIKQDLKWIIQSRRKAEGKEEIKVEFKKPIKDELTSEEVVKRMRRRELNRLAARRSREKGQRRKEKLVEEIKSLQSQNSELINDLTFLTDQRDNIIKTLRQHMMQCSDYAATRNAAAGLPRHILDMLGFLHEHPSQSPSSSSSQEERSTSSSLTMSSLYIETSPSKDPSLNLSQSSHIHQMSAAAHSPSLSSCPPSPIVIGVTGAPIMGQRELPTSFDASPSIFHNMPSLSSPPQTSGVTSTQKETESKLSRDPAAYSSPRISPRRAHSFHHTPWHEASSSSSSPLKQNIQRDSYEEFTRPASPSPLGAHHPSRFSLERSISCPSATGQAQVQSESLLSMPGKYAPSAEMTGGTERNYLSSSPADLVGIQDGDYCKDQDTPLDLVVRSKTTDSIIYNLPSSSSMDTWPRRSNLRSALTRGIGRRWSVDDQRSAHRLEPLNLSTRDDAKMSHQVDPS